MHNRTQLRQALVALLTPAIAPTPLFDERRTRIDSTLRPCVILSLGGDTIEPSDMAMGAPAYDVERTQALTLEVHVEGFDGSACTDAIDALELLIEGALASDLQLGGLCEMLYPVASDLVTDDGIDRIVAVRSLNYAIMWRSTFGAPDIPEA